MTTLTELPKAVESVVQVVLDYTKLDGTRAAKIFNATTETDGMERAQAAIAKVKAANPSHDMQETLRVVAALVVKRKHMTRAQLRSEMAQQAYFSRTAPNCGRALGYDC